MKKTATRRLNLAQAFNPIGALTGLFVAQTFILGSLQSDDVDAQGNVIYDTLSESAKTARIRVSDLMVVRNPYVILGLFVLFMFFLIAIVKMPEKKESIGGSVANAVKPTF